MGSRDSEHAKEFRKSLEGWTDHRFVSGEEIHDLSMFSVYLVNLLEDVGVQYYGHTFKIGTPMCVLVVKGDIDGTPHVVFSSGRTHTACIHIFLRKLQEEWLEWQVDRYR